MIIAGHQVDDSMFNYIVQNADADSIKLLLKSEPALTFDKSFAVLQIESRRKCRDKIPHLLQNYRFLFPKSICAEQCTNQVIAQFHATQIGACDHVLDMTMGMGVDAYYIAQHSNRVTAIELDPEIAAVGKYNYENLCPSINVLTGDSVEYLNTLDKEKNFDAIFIDPARRDSHGNRVYGLADCLPDILSLLPSIKRHTTRLFIKASPMIDIKQSVRDLGSALTDVWAISVGNECKELFFKLDFNVDSSDVYLHALNHANNSWQEFSTTLPNASAITSYRQPQPSMILYEPNASIMKLGCYAAVQSYYGISAIAPNSHLFINDNLINDFPGRCFTILEVIPFKSKEIKRFAGRYQQLNVSTRNFRLTSEQLKQRLRVQDGGKLYLFATTLSTSEQVMILCEKAL